MLRIIGLVAVLALLIGVGTSILSVGSADAAIHPAAQSECAVDGTPGDDQNPPGVIGNPSTGEGMPHDGLTHPWQNQNDKGTSGEGNNNCTNN